MHPVILFATAFLSALFAQQIPDNLTVGAGIRLFAAALLAGIVGITRPQNVPPANPPPPAPAPAAPTVIVNNPPSK